MIYLLVLLLSLMSAVWTLGAQTLNFSMLNYEETITLPL